MNGGCIYELAENHFGRYRDVGAVQRGRAGRLLPLAAGIQCDVPQGDQGSSGSLCEFYFTRSVALMANDSRERSFRF